MEHHTNLSQRVNLKQKPYQIWNINFCKTQPFTVTKICLGTLSNIMSTQTWKFWKIKLWVLAGISSNTGSRKSNRIKLHWCCTVRARPSAVAMLSGLTSIVSSSLCPDPSQEKRREAKVCTQAPLPVTHCHARCRPAWRRQRIPTGPRGRPSDPPARERERRDRSELATLPGPLQRRASGRACSRRLGL
jgi:hypothetical protein